MFPVYRLFCVALCLIAVGGCGEKPAADSLPEPADSPHEFDSAASRVKSENNLKNISLASLNFASGTGGTLCPPAAATGQHKVSWRVLMLGAIDRSDLRRRYRMNEPWDSENNKQLLKEMPDCYRHPGDKPGSTNTSYFMLVGKDTAVGVGDEEQAATLDSVNAADGLNTTLFFVESKKSVPWTKPEDIEIDLKQDLPQIGGWYKDGFYAAFGDGQVRLIPQSLTPQTLKNLIQVNDGREVELP